MVRLEMDAEAGWQLAEAAVPGPRPEVHASSSDPETWCSYEAALGVVQAGKADGISYVLTAAIRSRPSISITAAHATDAFNRLLGAEFPLARPVSPMGKSRRAGRASGYGGSPVPTTKPVNRKFTFTIDGKPIAAEIFRRAPKILTVSATGSTPSRRW